MRNWLEPLAGGIVLTITLLDVFLTVLYARAGTGVLAPRLARSVWRVFRGLSGGKHSRILNYCGPAQLVALVLMWGLLLALGSGLVIHPALGTGIQSSSGETEADFVTALFVGGSSMSIVGGSRYGPTSPGYKLLFEVDGALLLRTLNESFPVQARSSVDSPRSREQWRVRYGRALQRLRDAGIPTRADGDAGAQEYVELRAKWEPGIEALAPALGFRMEDVDPAGSSRLPRAH